MKMTRVFTLLMLSAIHAGIVSAQRKGSDEKPNILIIVPDDLGWSDVGYNGSYIRTPHIDRLAREGIRLDHHYVMTTCTHTRVSLMTGKYPSRYGVLGPDYGEVIYAGEPTLASVLSDNGYTASISGSGLWASRRIRR